MYQMMYTHLFNAVSDALHELQSMNCGTAKKILMQAQIDCEEIYMQAGERMQDQMISIVKTNENE